MFQPQFPVFLRCLFFPIHMGQTGSNFIHPHSLQSFNTTVHHCSPLLSEASLLAHLVKRSVATSGSSEANYRFCNGRGCQTRQKRNIDQQKKVNGGKCGNAPT